MWTVGYFSHRLDLLEFLCPRSHTLIFLPNTGQIRTFGLACAGRTETKSNSFSSIPQNFPMPFLPYKTMKQLQRQVSTDRNSTSLFRKQKPVDVKPLQTNLQVVSIYAGGNQNFVRISSRVCIHFERSMFRTKSDCYQAQRPDDHRIFYQTRPLLELNLDFAKWLSHTSDSSDAEKLAFSIEEISMCSFFLRKLSRLFNTEACLNGSFLSLPDTHYRTSSNNPGIDLNQVIEVMDKLRSCDPKVQEMVRIFIL